MKPVITILRWPIICLLAIALIAFAALFSPTPGAANVSQAEAFKLLPPVTPSEPPEPPDCTNDITISVRADPLSIVLGQSTVVSWSVDVPFGCVGNVSVRLNDKPVAKSGSQTVTPSSSSTYAVRVLYTIQGVHAESTASTTVTVADPNLDERGCPIPKPETPETIEIREANPKIDKEHHDQMVRCLINAIQVPNTTILLGPEVVLDFSNVNTTARALLWPGRSVTLTSASNTDPTLQAARTPHSSGPQLIFGRHRSEDKTFIAIDCAEDNKTPADNVRISGFQLIGPDYGQQSDDDIGIGIYRCLNIEISNMEIAGWGAAGISIVDDEQPADGPGQEQPDNNPGERIGSPEQIRIFGNYIHHNQHPQESWLPFGGHATGYGVVVSDGAWAQIYENVFDLNRHAIAASGNAGGYESLRNLVLKGGGVHNDGFFTTHTHQFDVHGEGESGKGGRAGVKFLFANNSFQYLADNAIYIRGTPQKRIDIRDNIFAHEGLEDDWGHDAIKLQKRDDINRFIFLGPNNVKNFDSYGRYGVCDFDGDGIDDLFLATGQTWWYSSSGKFRWTYLSHRTERLDQVKLGYFDDDQRCDVLTDSGSEWVIANGGIGPWTSIGAFGFPATQAVFGRFDPSIRDHRPGRTRRTTHAFRRLSGGEWQVTPLAMPAWQTVSGSSFPMSRLRFGDFTGDGVTDVLAVENGRWAISESGLFRWRNLNPRLADPVENLVIANMDSDDNIDDILRLDRKVVIGPGANVHFDRITLTWLRSKNGTEPWERWKSYEFAGVNLTDDPVQPRFGFAGRFGFTPGGGTLIIGQDRKGHFHSKAEVAAGRDPDWTSLFPY